ncbi:MAG: hypothetical protein WEB00_08050 [Dehalococcoidia bacterium]
MNKKAGNKRPTPSYEEGELRDKSIELKMDADFTQAAFRKVLKGAVKGSGAPPQS